MRSCRCYETGINFAIFLSLIHYDFACHETLYNEMTSEIRISKIRRKITEMRNTNFTDPRMRLYCFTSDTIMAADGSSQGPMWRKCS